MNRVAEALTGAREATIARRSYRFAKIVRQATNSQPDERRMAQTRNVHIGKNTPTYNSSRTPTSTHTVNHEMKQFLRQSDINCHENYSCS